MNRLERKIDILTNMVEECCDMKKNLKLNTPQNPSVPYISTNPSKSTPEPFSRPPSLPPAPPAGMIIPIKPIN